jgi:hypothetical protein
MLLRRITQASDFQGPAPLDDRDTSEDTLHLLFGTAQEVENARFPSALALEQPLLVFYSTSAALRPTWSPFPSQNETLFVDFFVRHSVETSSAPEYALRVQSFAPGGEFVNFQSLLPRAAKVSACAEVTLSFQELRAKVCSMHCTFHHLCIHLRQHSLVLQNDGERLLWKSSAGQEAARPVDVQGDCADFFIDELDIRSFAVQFQQQ